MQPEQLDVISAFIDDEPFDAKELGDALSLREGREQLIDLIALRHIVSADVEPGAEARSRRIVSPWRGVLAAAVLALAVGGAFLAGREMTTAGVKTPEKDPEVISEAPAASRVIELRPGIEWHQTGGNR